MPCSLSVSSRWGRTGRLHETPSSRETATTKLRACAEPLRLIVQCAASPRSPNGTTAGTSEGQAARLLSFVTTRDDDQALSCRTENRSAGMPEASGSTQLRTTRFPVRWSRGAKLPNAAGGSLERPPEGPQEQAEAIAIVRSASVRHMTRTRRSPNRGRGSYTLVFTGRETATSTVIRVDHEGRVVRDRVEDRSFEHLVQRCL